MRLKSKEVETIKTITKEIFSECKIYLFGSRLDDTKKGGDIDIYIITEDKKDLFAKKIKTLVRLKRALHKPVDILIHRDFNSKIEKEALKGILL